MNKLFLLLFLVSAVLLNGCGKNEAVAPIAVNPEKANDANDMSPGAATPERVITFVELGSVNCIPCKAMQPVMKSIESKYKGKVKVVFHDVWTKEGEVYGRKFMIRAIPTQIFLDEKGNEFFRHEGFFPEEQIDKLMQSRGISL